MKVSAQEIEPRQMVLEIEVEEERVKTALDQAYKRIVNRINVPGFRRGRAPRPLVERMVGREAILEDAVEHLVPQVYQDALKEQQITPAGQPALEVTSTEPLQFKATVPLQPKVDLGDYASIGIEPEAVAVEDSEVDAVVQNLRESNATWAPVERPAQLGDRVGIDVKAVQGERVVMDSHDVEYVINPEGPEPAKGFAQQLLGMEAESDRAFALQPETLNEEDEPEPLGFQTRVLWVKEKQLPELDDEFARTVGQKESLDLLRSDIGDELRQRKEAQSEQRHRDGIVQAAIDQATIEIPPQMVERQAHHLLESMASRLDKQGMSIEQYLQITGQDEEAFKTELLKEAEGTLKRSLVLEAIADAESIAPSDAEVRQEIELASQDSADPVRTARQALARPETKAGVVSVLRSRGALSRLVELATGETSTPEKATEEPEEGPHTGESNV